MFFFKPEVLKYRAVVGHMVVKVGQKVGKAVTRGLGDFVPSELLSSPDNRETKDVDRKPSTVQVPPAVAQTCGAKHGFETLKLGSRRRTVVFHVGHAWKLQYTPHSFHLLTQPDIQAGLKTKRRTSGWQGESATIRAFNMRERSTHDSDEDFGALANRDFFPTTSSTGFSHDGTAPSASHIAMLQGPSDAGVSDGLTGRQGSASAHMFGGECSVYEHSLHVDNSSSALQ